MKIGDYVVIGSNHLLERRYDIVVLRKTVELYYKNTERLAVKIDRSDYDYLVSRRIIKIYDFTGHNDFTDGAPITRRGYFPFYKWITIHPRLIEDVIAKSN